MNKLSYARSMQSLIKEFSKMPGIGTKTAERLAFYVLKLPKEDAEHLSQSILKVKSSIRFCKICNNLSEDEVCLICQNESRDRALICVVEEPNDVFAIEKIGKFNGVYHVLLGRLSPLDGIGPDALKINELIERVNPVRDTKDTTREGKISNGVNPVRDIKDTGVRSSISNGVKDNKVREVIIATNSDTEGETTALYIAKLLRPFRLKITRLAHGIPVGSDLKYADQATLMKAIEGRVII